MDTKSERNARNRANAALYELGTHYHESLNCAIFDIDAILIRNGFDGLEEGIYCGRDGRVNEQVGPRTWFSMTWHRMESGRYEIVAYCGGGR
jgi:hypothetical protein